MRRLLVLIAAVGAPLPAAAQDLGNVNPAQWASSLPMESAIRAQSRQRSARSDPVEGSASARRTCAELPEYRARLGAGDRRIRQLTRLCRQAGYN